MKLPKAETSDRHLSEWCQSIASICCSPEFKKLHKEMCKIYRRSGLINPTVIAFQDSLFSLYIEQLESGSNGEIPQF